MTHNGTFTWFANGLWVAVLVVLFFLPVVNSETSGVDPRLGDDDWWRDAPVSKNNVELWIDGPIIDGETADKFMREISGGAVHTVYLDSFGGSLNEAIRIAYMIDERNIRTEIPMGAECASACAIIFLAGYQRDLRGRLGVHQFTPSDPDVTPSEVQYITSRLIRVINDLDAPSSLLAYMMSTPAESMFWYGPESAAAFRRTLH